MDKDFQTFEEKYMEEHEGEIVSVYDRHAGLVDGAEWGIEHVKKSQESLHDPETSKENGNSLTCSASDALREKAKELGQVFFPDEQNVWARANYEAMCVEQACIKMAQWQKEQMMKDAIDATKVFSGIGSNSKTGECVPYTEYKICISDKLCDSLDKVKLIIIKEKQT